MCHAVDCVVFGPRTRLNRTGPIVLKTTTTMFQKVVVLGEVVRDDSRVVGIPGQPTVSCDLTGCETSSIRKRDGRRSDRIVLVGRRNRETIL